jgi:hypothetical protein
MENPKSEKAMANLARRFRISDFGLRTSDFALMSDSPPPNPELLRSLGRLVRGLSALFWGLPVALLVLAETLKTDWLRAYTVFPPLATTGLLLFGLWQIGAFQKQERPWRAALDRSRFLALINFGLSPFLYWWSRVPESFFFTLMVCILAVSALLFLFTLNQVLLRLGAMLPDETLRSETQQYTAVNQYLLGALFLIAVLYVALKQTPELPVLLERIADSTSFVALIFLVLLPLAMTMALIWKTKEVILDNVFGGESGAGR